MNAIRNEICDFIRIADEKKINALYELLEQDIEAKKGWWLDANVVEELESRYNALKSGEDKGVSLDEVTGSIAEKRKKKYGG